MRSTGPAEMESIAEQFSATEVALSLGVHPATVYRWGQTGSVPSIRIGGKVRFDLEAVRAAVVQRGGTRAMEAVEYYIKKARETWVIDHDNGVTQVVAHPGQELNLDPKYLRENFGIDDPARVIRMIDSRESPLRDAATELAMAERGVAAAEAHLDEVRQANAAAEASFQSAVDAAKAAAAEADAASTDDQEKSTAADKAKAVSRSLP